jgi:hypothetical protein
MPKELAMTHRLRWLWIAGLIACTSAPSTDRKTLPDRFEEDLDLLVRATTQPCGADTDTDGDGAVDVHWVYLYDANGPSRQDVGRQLDGQLYQQIDYAWDNAGHLLDYLTTVGAGLKIDRRSTYDTPGRRLSNTASYFSGSTLTMRNTITFSGFDELGHPARGDEVDDDLLHGTSTTRSRSFRYDTLGRRINLDVSNADGSVYQGWTHVYDDTARTVTTTLRVPSLPTGSYQEVTVDSYDASNHYLGGHTVHTSLDDHASYTIDSTVRWNGDRERSYSLTSSDPTFPGESTTFQYECSSRAMTGRSAYRM